MSFVSTSSRAKAISRPAIACWRGTEEQAKVTGVIGISKGRGFAGVVRRHHFRGSDETHGSMFHRALRSVRRIRLSVRGAASMRMGGQMGNARATTGAGTQSSKWTPRICPMIVSAVPGAERRLCCVAEV